MSIQFGKKKLVRDISANTLQIGITQVFSLAIFYFTSRFLAKSDFGELNWSTAVGSTIIALASLGLDVVFVKRVASSESAVEISGIHFLHTLLVAVVLSLLALLTELIFPDFKSLHPLFLLVFIYLCISNMANSFKLCLMGLETYSYLAILAFIVNVFKFGAIVTLYFLNRFSIFTTIYIFMITSVLEFVLGYVFVGRSIKVPVRPLFKPIDYKYFILESLPQLGVVFFDSALARIDWILLGIISTATATAEYSFAYRMYESSKLPLLVIAPILLTRFSKLYTNPDRIDEQNKRNIESFFKVELFIVMLLPVALICVWSPLVDGFTDNKYGSVNHLNYLLLAGCVPLHCICNFLWSMGFAQGQLKAILFITIAVALINLVLNLILIPMYNNEGASVAFLISTIVQTVLYWRYMKQDHLQLNVANCLLAFFNAVVSLAAALLLTNNVIFAALTALGLMTALAFTTRQLNYRDLKKLIKS